MAAYTTKTTNTDDTEQGGNRTPHIDARTAYDAFDESRRWYRPYFDPLNELERIARNKPSESIDPNLPRITDGTTASVVQETPKRTIQQLATGKIDCKEHPEYGFLADLIHTERLLPNYNRMGTALQKHWNMSSKAMIYGSSVSYTFLTETNGIIHTDFTIPYRKDVGGEKGKVFAPDSNVQWMRCWYQRSDLKAILNREVKFQKEDKNYKSDWDLKLLGQFIDSGAKSKDNDSMTAAEREKGGDNGGYEVIYVFQKGIGAESYAISPHFQNGKPLRTKISKDPRGKIPLDYEYCNIDLSNPVGRGQVEVSGGVQNLMDQKLQMNQFLSTMLMGPPLQVFGDVNMASLKFMPNAIWKMGTNPNNRVEPYQVSNIALQSFIPDMQFLQSKIYNLNNSQDTSIPAANGTVGNSKTDAGVNAQEAKLGVSDNYLRKQHEAWVQDQTETSVNIYFAEVDTEETITLNNKQLKEIQKTPAAQFLIEGTKDVRIPFKEINEVSFKFTVNPSSSEVKEDNDNADKLTQIYQIMSSDPDPAIQQKKQQVLKLLVNEIGAEGTDDLFPEEVDEMGNPIDAQQQDPNALMQQIMPQVQQMVAEMLEQSKATEKPEEAPELQLIKALGLKFEQLPEGARQIVLEQVGMNTGEATPADTKQDIETLNAIQGADAHDREPEMQEKALASKNKETSAPQETSKTETTSEPAEDELSPEETELVEVLDDYQFTDDDIAQAITMKRSGMPDEQIIATLGAKYAAA